MELSIIRTTVYAGAYWPTWSLLHITQGCTHNACKFLTGPHFLDRKENTVAALDHEILHGDLDRMAAVRRSKRSL